MFIELTDHLRCPVLHAEGFLVLLPAHTEGRRVVSGHLGCPVCGWGASWEGGTPDFGDSVASHGAPPFDGAAAVALLGVDGPGGWIATAGNAGAIAADLAALLPGVHVVAVNPPEEIVSDGAVSVIRSGRWPIKRHSMRGVVVGDDVVHAGEAVASALPGLRACGSGHPPDGIELMAQGGAVWVGQFGGAPSS